MPQTVNVLEDILKMGLNNVFNAVINALYALLNLKTAKLAPQIGVFL